MIEKLDIPVRQVLIESRIVNADETFMKDIGARFGYSKNTGGLGTGGGVRIGGAQAGSYSIGGRITGLTVGDEDERESLIVDLPAGPTDASSLAIVAGRVGSYLLQLELSALIAEGRGEDIASPRVITANQSEAVIESGVEIPYQEATSSGATNVSFKDAVLRLRVTPHITPDDRIIMDLKVDQDNRQCHQDPWCAGY